MSNVSNLPDVFNWLLINDESLIETVRGIFFFSPKYKNNICSSGHSSINENIFCIELSFMVSKSSEEVSSNLMSNWSWDLIVSVYFLNIFFSLVLISNLWTKYFYQDFPF